MNLGEDHWVSIAEGIGVTKCSELTSIFAVYWNISKTTYVNDAEN